jgi:transposase
VATKNPVSDDLWEAIQPLLPPEPARTCGGPPRISHRAALAGILYVSRQGLRWRDLPQELGFGSGIPCWRRLHQWQGRGVWQAVHQVIFNWLGDLDAIDWSRASLDSVSVRAKRGGEHTGPNPTDRGKAGSTYSARTRPAGPMLYHSGDHQQYRASMGSRCQGAFDAGAQGIPCCEVGRLLPSGRHLWRNNVSLPVCPRS